MVIANDGERIIFWLLMEILVALKGNNLANTCYVKITIQPNSPPPGNPSNTHGLFISGKKLETKWISLDKTQFN